MYVSCTMMHHQSILQCMFYCISLCKMMNFNLEHGNGQIHLEYDYVLNPFIQNYNSFGEQFPKFQQFLVNCFIFLTILSHNYNIQTEIWWYVIRTSTRSKNVTEVFIICNFQQSVKRMFRPETFYNHSPAIELSLKSYWSCVKTSRTNGVSIQQKLPKQKSWQWNAKI